MNNNSNTPYFVSFGKYEKNLKEGDRIYRETGNLLILKKYKSVWWKNFLNSVFGCQLRTEGLKVQNFD